MILLLALAALANPAPIDCPPIAGPVFIQQQQSFENVRVALGPHFSVKQPVPVNNYTVGATVLSDSNKDLSFSYRFTDPTAGKSYRSKETVDVTFRIKF